MKDLKEIESSLDQLYSDFNHQLEALGSDSKEFHKSLIELSSKYPDHKELLQFIVFINDKIETKQSMFSDIVVDSFNELVRTKKFLVRKMIEQQKIHDAINAPKKPWWKSFKFDYLKEIKGILFLIVVMVIISLVVFLPNDRVDKVTDTLTDIVKEIKK